MTSTLAGHPAAYASGQLLAAVRELRPLIESHRRWAHENARMAPAVLEACREAGVFTSVSPREVGGADVQYPELIRIFEELGYSDPSVARHTGNSFAIAGYAAHLDEPTRRALFDGAPGPFGFSGIPAGVARQVAGGYLLRGRWQFLTGSQDAPWSWLHGFVFEGDTPRLLGDKPDLRAFIVQTAELSLEQTWQSAVAMRGTGSHAVSTEDLFVPEGFAFSLLGMPPRHLESNSSRWPRFAASPITNAATALGIVRRMIDEAIDLVNAQKPRMDYTAYAARPDIQRTIARGRATIDAHSHGFAAMAGEIQRAVNEREKISLDMRARMWATFWGALDAARLVGNDMVMLGTSKLYSQPNLMDLCLHDLNAIAAATEADRDYQEAAGRVFMGLPPGKVPF